MTDDGTTQGMEPAAGDRDREERLLASSRVEATVEGVTLRGTAEVLLERGPRAVAVECLFDRGVEADLAAAMVREPGQLSDVLFDGRAVAGRGTRATFFDDDDSAKLLVTWRPAPSSVEAALADLGLGGGEA